MKYIDFHQRVSLPLFTSQNIRNLGAANSPSQLTDWQKKGYITKLRGGLYAFTDRLTSLTPEMFAPHLVSPSYLSLEYALSHYGIIPETVFSYTSITTKITRSYKLTQGSFVYRHVSKHLFFGYNLINSSPMPYYLAEKEKALLDFLYLSPHIVTLNDLHELRLNTDSLDWGKLKTYVHVFGQQRMIHLIKILEKAYAHT